MDLSSVGHKIFIAGKSSWLTWIKYRLIIQSYPRDFKWEWTTWVLWLNHNSKLNFSLHLNRTTSLANLKILRIMKLFWLGQPSIGFLMEPCLQLRTKEAARRLTPSRPLELSRVSPRFSDETRHSFQFSNWSIAQLVTGTLDALQAIWLAASDTSSTQVLFP